MQLLSNDEWAKQCNNDGEFAIAARRWRGGIKLTLGDQTLALKVNEGVAQGRFRHLHQ